MHTWRAPLASEHRSTAGAAWPYRVQATARTPSCRPSGLGIAAPGSDWQEGLTAYGPRQCVDGVGLPVLAAERSGAHNGSFSALGPAPANCSLTGLTGFKTGPQNCVFLNIHLCWLQKHVSHDTCCVGRSPRQVNAGGELGALHKGHCKYSQSRLHELALALLYRQAPEQRMHTQKYIRTCVGVVPHAFARVCAPLL